MLRKIYFTLLFLCSGIMVAADINTNTYRAVLTGGPGVGKSMMIDLLHEKGYQTIPEVWTLLFNEAKECNCIELFNKEAASTEFRKKLMKKQLSMENEVSKEQPVFLDRSTVDVVAFGHYYKVEMPDSITQIPETDRYDFIFFTDPVPQDLYNKPNCSQEESVIIHKYLEEFYTKMGYSLIKVPFDTPQKRVTFILNTLAQKLKK